MKKSVSFVLILILIFSNLQIPVSAANITVIRNASQLQNINNKLDGNYILSSDIDLSSIANWTPIGNSSNPFTGIFNGNGYTISGLSVFSDQPEEIGLFGYVSGGTIKNLHVSGSIKSELGDFSGEFVFAYAGGIAGNILNSTIEQCSFSGTVSCSVGNCCYSRAGGITTAVSSTLRNCYSDANVYAFSKGVNVMAAGICVWSDYTVIDKCYFAGTVKGETNSGYCYVGGINASGGGTITNCVVNSNSIVGSTGNSSAKVYINTVGNFGEYFNNLTYNATQSECENLGWDFDNIWEASPNIQLQKKHGSVEALPDGFNFYLKSPSNYINVGRDEELNVGYYVNGVVDTSTKNYIFTVSNPDVISVTNDKWTDDHGQFMTIRAFKSGESRITVTNPSNGDSAALDIYVTGNEYGWTFENLPRYEYESGRITHFYNYSGMVIDDFNYKSHVDNNGRIDYYIVTMNVFNSLNLMGAVTAYDSDGNLSGYCIIDKKNELETSFVDSCKALYYNVGDLYYLIKNNSYYSGKSITKETKVEIKVPVGGYILISNNIVASPIVNYANLISMIIDYVKICSKYMKPVEISDSVFDDATVLAITKVMQELFTGEWFQEKMADACQDAVLNQVESFDMENIDVFLQNICEKLFNDFGIDLIETLDKELVSDEGLLKVAESIGKKILPTGWIIDLLYSGNKAGNYVMFSSEYKNSSSRPFGITIYAPSGNTYWRSNGINVRSDDYSDEVVVHSYLVENNSYYHNSSVPKDIDSIQGNQQIYSITMYKNGNEVQPSSKVTVEIPLPMGYSFTEYAIKLYRINEDGTLTSIDFIIKNGYIVFETDHFSYYAVVEQKKTDILIGDADGNGSLNMKDVLLLRKVIAGAEGIDPNLFANADLDGNGDINMKDVLKLRKIIAGVE